MATATTTKSVKSAALVTVALALRANLANRRVAIAHTKDKSEVRGGGRKPWKQKGTGRARHGSNRSPIWVGGGITFGPRNDRNFALSINKKQKDLALATLVADKKESGKVVTVSTLPAFSGKTKEVVKFLSDQNVADKALIIVDDVYFTSESGTALIRAAKNCQGVMVVPARKLNAYMLASDAHLVTTDAVLSQIINKA